MICFFFLWLSYYGHFLCQNVSEIFHGSLIVFVHLFNKFWYLFCASSYHRGWQQWTKQSSCLHAAAGLIGERGSKNKHRKKHTVISCDTCHQSKEHGVWEIATWRVIWMGHRWESELLENNSRNEVTIVPLAFGFCLLWTIFNNVAIGIFVHTYLPFFILFS